MATVQSPTIVYLSTLQRPTPVGEVFPEVLGRSEAIAKLQAAKTKQPKVKQDTVEEQTDLRRQIAENREKLGTLGVVRSPDHGMVTSLKWLGQVDQKLQIELVLSSSQTATL